MIQRAIGVTVGAIVTLIILVIMNLQDPGWEDYLVPLAIGAVASFFWPVVIGFWLGRRARQRRNNQIQSEVARQVNEQNRNG
jgi:NADH:ubiquinone oxidoreductase subunit 6 (subunit J)